MPTTSYCTPGGPTSTTFLNKHSRIVIVPPPRVAQSNSSQLRSCLGHHRSNFVVKVGAHLFEISPGLPVSGQTVAEAGQLRTKFGRCPTWPIPGQFRPTSCRFRPTSGQIWSESEKQQPKSGQLCSIQQPAPFKSIPGKLRSNLVSGSPKQNLGRNWPHSARYRPKSAQIWLIPGRIDRA